MYINDTSQEILNVCLVLQQVNSFYIISKAEMQLGIHFLLSDI